MKNEEILEFHLPRYKEITNMGLFLEQVTKYINKIITPLDEEMWVTPAMISNYVKLKIATNPNGKTYARDNIVELIFICLMKNVVPLNDLSNMFYILSKVDYTLETAYDYFAAEFENVLKYVFKNQKSLPYIGGALTDSKHLLKNIILALVYKIFVKQQLKSLIETMK